MLKLDDVSPHRVAAACSSPATSLRNITRDRLVALITPSRFHDPEFPKNLVYRNGRPPETTRRQEPSERRHMQRSSLHG
jgi:hypothetical protein